MSRKKRRRKRQQATATLSPVATPNDPGNSGANTMIMPAVRAGVRVNEDTALTLGAVWACIKVISEDLGKLPWGVFEKLRAGGRSRVEDDPADWLLDVQANPEVPAFQWRETILAHALAWGNGFAEIERDLMGRPVWLWNLTPDRVTPQRVNGRIVYVVKNPSGQEDTILEANEVFHLRGLGFDGLVGYPVIRMFARSIGLGISLEESAASFSQNDSTPGGVLEHPGRLSAPASANLRESWMRSHGGPSRRRTVAVLEEGMKWTQTQLPPEDSQLVEQRQFTPAEICRIFRVAPHKIADLIRAHFSNIEESNLDHAGDTLLPWAKRLEGEANIKFFGRNTRRKRFTKINFMGLLRGKANERADFYTKMLDRGVLCVNDVLELEDRNPIGPEGDQRFVPLNMQILSEADGAEGNGEDSEEVLEVPDVPQLYDWDCGAAVAAAVCEFFQIPMATYEDYIAALGTTPENGTDPQAMVSFFLRRGLTVTAGQNMTFENLAEFVSDGRPVICAVQDYGTPATETGGRSGHYVIAIGVGLGHVFLRDPAFSQLVKSTGDLSSARRVVSEEDFMTDWHDIGADGSKYIQWGLAIGEEVMTPQPPEPKMDQQGQADQGQGNQPPMPKNMEEMKAAFFPVLEEACGRFGARMVHRLGEANKKLPDISPWLNSKAGDLASDYATEILGTPSRALAASLGGNHAAADIAVEVFVGAHLNEWKRDQSKAPNPADLAARIVAAVEAGRISV